MAGAPPDFEAEGLLDGLDGDARDARRRLLEHLFEEGIPLDRLRMAVEEGRLALLPAERVIAGEPRHTVEEVAELAGLDVELLRAQLRANGLPVPEAGEPALSDRELEGARRLAKFYASGIPREAILEVGRVFGESAARAAGAVRSLVGGTLVRAGDTELDLGLRLERVAQELNDPAGDLLKDLYAWHLREQIRGDVVEAQALAEGRLFGTQEVAVCFADLVGFTRLGQGVDPEDLTAVATRLATLAGEIAEAPVRLVKTIGDAAMLVSPEPAPLVDAALALIDAVEAQEGDMPQLRAGLAYGEAVQRWGDWYGSTVNLASRVCGRARPATVLVTEELRDVLGEERFSFSFAGAHRLKGFERPVPLLRCRRREPEN